VNQLRDHVIVRDDVARRAGEEPGAETRLCGRAGLDQLNLDHLAGIAVEHARRLDAALLRGERRTRQESCQQKQSVISCHL
jgi:hypothetical protein